MPEMTCSDIHLRHTDGSGRTTVRQHRVWDADLFLSSQQSAARKINADAAKDGKPTKVLEKIELIDAATYQRERTRR